MDARLSYFDNDTAMKFAKHINSAGAVLTGSSLPAAQPSRSAAPGRTGRIKLQVRYASLTGTMQGRVSLTAL
jgi:hypothetical protein